MPSGDVITRLPTPELATATKNPSPYATDSHPSSEALVRLVHVMPSGDVITRLPVPLIATATNNPFPYATEAH